jgi:integrase/recombinase XerD
VSKLVIRNTRRLTEGQFNELAAVPAEYEWLANLKSEKTKVAYRNDVADFVHFSGLDSFGALRAVKRMHVIAWRKDMESRGLERASRRRKLSALSSLFDYLCERNAVAGNPVDGVERPESNGNEGSTPAMGAEQARRLLDAPSAKTLKGIRDRAILATLLYHGLRRAELCNLTVGDMHTRQGVLHFRIVGKRNKIRFIPVHFVAKQLIRAYLAKSKHGHKATNELFRPVKNNRTAAGVERPLDPSSVYRNVVRHYGKLTGIHAEVNGLRAHSLRATAATNALTKEADIAKVQEWLGHANISTTRLYDRRQTTPDESPTFKIEY